MEKEGEVEEGRERPLRDRNSTIVFRVLLLMIIEQCGIVEGALDWKSADVFSWLRFAAV